MHNKPSPTRPKRNGNLCIRQHYMQSKAAMSLMEISIVIVILGLLTTAIIGGASIRKMAGQKHLVSSINAMTQSLLLFKQTYGYWPGDFPNANEVFGPMSNIYAHCPTLTPDGDETIYIKGISGNGNGTVDATAVAPYTFDWGAESMYMACHMLLSKLAPSNMIGNGMCINQNVDIRLLTSPTHSTFKGHTILHLPTYKGSFLTYGTTISGLPAIQVNSNKNIYKDIFPILQQAKDNRSLDTHTQDILIQKGHPSANNNIDELTEVRAVDLDASTISEDGKQSIATAAECTPSKMLYTEKDPVKACNNIPITADSSLNTGCGNPYGETASECHILTGSGFTTYDNTCVFTFHSWTFLKKADRKFSVRNLYIPVSE